MVRRKKSFNLCVTTLKKMLRFGEKLQVHMSDLYGSPFNLYLTFLEDGFLFVSVPCTSLFKTVTVRCGHCTNLLSVNMRGLRLPAANQLHLGHSFFSPQNLLEEIRNSPSNMLNNQPNPNESFMVPVRGIDELPKPPVANRPPEKRQRVPSAYNRFIKDEIQRIKAGNPDISHREAFSAAAKNWAHFPHIHFGIMPDQPVKKPSVCQQKNDDAQISESVTTDRISRDSSLARKYVLKRDSSFPGPYFAVYDEVNQQRHPKERRAQREGGRVLAET